MLPEHRYSLPPGLRLRQYAIVRLLGHGGFGLTYLAEDTNLHRRVAIKEMLPIDFAVRQTDGTTVAARSQQDKANLEWARQRFVEEGRTLAALQHPSILHVYDIFELHGTAYLVTAFIEGSNFEDWLRTPRAVSQEDLLSMADSLLDALHLVHEQGFLHRDIKPENILMSAKTSRPVLIDFGNARTATGKITSSMTAVLTRGYAPLEQYQTKARQEPSADLYALGAVLYRAIKGAPPDDALDRLDEDKIQVLSEQGIPGYTREFLATIDKALQMRRTDRWQSCVEWKSALRTGSQTKPSPPPAPARRSSAGESQTSMPRSQTPPRSRARINLAVVSIALLFLCGGGFGLYKWINAGPAGAPPSEDGGGGVASIPNSTPAPPFAAAPPRVSSVSTLPAVFPRPPVPRDPEPTPAQSVAPVAPAADNALPPPMDVGNTVKVGVLHSLSGTMAISEISLRDMLLFTFDEINKKGGVMGKTIEPVIADGASNWPLFAEKAAELLEKDKVAVTFGCWTSVSRKSVLPVFEKDNGLLFYPVQFEGEELSKNIFYTAEAVNQQAIPAVDYLLSQGRKKFYLLGSDYVCPQTINLILLEYLRSKGVPLENLGGGFKKDESGKIISFGKYTPFGHTDYQQIVAEIKQFAAGGGACVISSLNGDTNVPFFKEYAAAGLISETCPVCNLSIAEDEFRGLPARLLVGQLCCWTYFMSLKSSENKKFLAHWAAWVKTTSADVNREGRVVDSPMVLTYDGVYLWKAAVEKAGSFDVTKVTAALEKGISFDGPGGTVTSQRNHHLTKDVFIGEIKADGQFKILKEFRNVFGEPFLKGTFRPK